MHAAAGVQAEGPILVYKWLAIPQMVMVPNDHRLVAIVKGIAAGLLVLVPEIMISRHRAAQHFVALLLQGNVWFQIAMRKYGLRKIHVKRKVAHPFHRLRVGCSKLLSRDDLRQRQAHLMPSAANVFALMVTHQAEMGGMITEVQSRIPTDPLISSCPPIILKLLLDELIV